MKLTNQNIADVVEKIQNFFEPIKLPKKEKIRILLLIEEVLLRYQEKFGEDHDFDFVKKKWFGTPKISIKIKGTPYNPLEDNDESQIFSEKIINRLLNYEKAGLIYRYENNYNEIIASADKEFRSFKIPGGQITILIVGAILTAFIISNFSQTTQNIFVYDILTPILNTLIGTLITVNLPLIFISIVASICAMEDVTMLNDVGSKILLRFLALMFFFAFMSIFICAIFFPVMDYNFSGNSSIGDKVLSQFFELILSIFPQDIFMAFVEKNILQIMVLAFVTGICVTMLGNRVSNFKNLIMDLRQIIFKIVGIVFRLIPIILFLFIIKIMLVYSATDILDVWKLIAVKYALFLAICFIMLLRISIKYDVKILDFLKKIYPAILISFKTASGVASLQKNLELCKKELKIDSTLCDFYIPLSHTLCSSTLVIGIVVSVFYAAEFSDTTISFEEIFIIAFLAVLFAIASVGGNGGIIATLSLLLTQLDFSLDAIGPIAVSDIFTAHFSIVAALIIRDCDLFDLSQKVKLSE